GFHLFEKGFFGELFEARSAAFAAAPDLERVAEVDVGRAEHDRGEILEKIDVPRVRGRGAVLMDERAQAVLAAAQVADGAAEIPLHGQEHRSFSPAQMAVSELLETGEYRAELAQKVLGEIGRAHV